MKRERGKAVKFRTTNSVGSMHQPKVEYVTDEQYIAHLKYLLSMCAVQISIFESITGSTRPNLQKAIKDVLEDE